MCKQKNNEFVACRSCPNMIKGGPSKGYYYDKVDGYDVIKECDCHRKWRQEQELQANLEKANINPDYTFDDYVGTKSRKDLDALKVVADKPEKFLYKTMIYIHGPNSCQKSSMVQALGKELVKKNYSVMYINFKELVNAVVVGSETFNDPLKEEKEYTLKKCTDCDFLIVDEAFDKSKATIYASGFQIPYIDNFIRTRFEILKRSIIFVSNKKQSEINEEGFGLSLQSLIERNTKNSTLVFTDVCSPNKGVPNRMALFEGANK